MKDTFHSRKLIRNGESQWLQNASPAVRLTRQVRCLASKHHEKLNFMSKPIAEISIHFEGKTFFLRLRLPPTTDAYVIKAVRSRINQLVTAMQKMDGRPALDVSVENTQDSDAYQWITWACVFEDPAFPAKLGTAVTSLAMFGLENTIH